METSMNEVAQRTEQLARESSWDFSDLRALIINCTLKRSPEVSNTQALGDIAIGIMERNGVTVDVVRAAPWTTTSRSECSPT